MNFFVIKQELKPFEFGLFKASKVIFWGGIAGVVIALQGIVSNWHPVTLIGGSELIGVNALLVWVYQWVQAHQQVKQAMAAQTPVVPIAPAPETPPAPTS